MDGKIVINPEQVVGRKSGWVSYIDNSGVQRKVRSSKITINGTTAVTPAPAEAASTEPSSSSPTEGQSEAKAPAPVEKSKVAKAKKAATRSIGDAEFKLSKYEQTKTASGHVSFDNADEVATKLRGKSLDDVYDIVAKKLDVTVKSLKEKYSKLNAGMQRMNLGNMYRKALGLTGGKKSAKKKAA